MNEIPMKFNLLVLLLLTMSSVVSAAPGDPPPPTPPPPPGAPIDNGIIYLVIIGLFYGVYILKRYKSQYK